MINIIAYSFNHLFVQQIFIVCCVPVTVLGKRDDSTEQKVTTVMEITSS